MGNSKDTLVKKLWEILEDFVDDLYGKLDDPHLMQDVLSGEEVLTGAMIGYSPEAYTEDNLIWRMLDVVGLDFGPRPWGGGDWPDFDIKNLDEEVIGENKPLNKIDEAMSDLETYLNKKTITTEFGIATDGIKWIICKIELGGDFPEYPILAEIDFRPVLIELARERSYLVTSGVTEVDVEERFKNFVDAFSRDLFNELLTEAPLEFRDERKKSVEDFYDLYIELLFGKGRKYDYDVTLLNTIGAPSGASETERKIFVITLVNRLFFIKFLEDKGVLPSGFLLDRVNWYEEYKDQVTGNLYDTQIKPLFYKLLNTPLADRSHKHRTGWFAEVPYLNGGLFRENVENEKQYEVLDYLLPTVIRDLIEGHRLREGNGGLDPSIIGSVFEKTINFIGGEEGRQKKIGAFYTPHDVTMLITSQTVDEKAKEIIVEAFAEERGEDADAFRRKYLDCGLSELLFKIEQQEGWFENPDAIKMALERIGELKILDPACGSGHFLTTAMDEINRIQLSLLRGLRRVGEEGLDQDEVYGVKKGLALTSIYGVDVDPVACEIAKLRIWLKIIEDGWEPGFGLLPNIDVNIAAGNSLVGFPVKGVVEAIDIWDERVEDLIDLRERYKYEEEGDKEEITALVDEIRAELDNRFLKRLTQTVKTPVDSGEEFDALIGSIDENALYPYLKKIQVKRRDGESFGEEDKDVLEELGFRCYTKSARLNVQKQVIKPEISSNLDDYSNRLKALLESGEYRFSEVKRRILITDLDNIRGKTLHWAVAFPEVAEVDNGQHSVNFDIVIGNPPYGDILNEHEKAIISTYDTADINDISANFVERQLQLLKEGGYFGNITTLRLVYQSSMETFHEMLRSNMDEAKIACFAKRPMKVFDNAEVRVAIITGDKDSSIEGNLLTSDFIRFSKGDREEQFRGVSYGSIDGLVLRDKIGGSGSYTAIPKVGTSTTKGILEKLKTSSDTVFRDKFEDEETEFVIWRRRGADNWVTPMLEKLYESQDTQPAYLNSKLKRNLVFLTLSSSLFYLYWMVYGNQHHVNWSEIKAFPFPEPEQYEHHSDKINELTEELWTGMKRNFNDELNHFDMPKLRHLVNKIDNLIGEIYGLTEEEIEFIKNYHAEYGRSGPKDGSILQA